MKKRLLSLFLVLAVVFSFSLSAFATDTGIDIIDDPLSYYLENQVLGVYKGTGVTLVCPKCDYKVVYTGGTLVTCPYDGEALVLSDLAGVHAEKVPSGIGRKDLPGYEDDEGTAQVSKEGVLTYVAHPRWFISDGGKKYSTVPYQDFYEHQIWDDEKCVAGSGHTSSCIDSEFYFTYTSGGYERSKRKMGRTFRRFRRRPRIYYRLRRRCYRLFTFVLRAVSHYVVSLCCGGRYL